MFTKNDIYTSSGSARLYNSWTPTVAKFDTSSFYNWEQDNLPIYDLEERTYELWEYNGYPTSSVPGLALVVSADAPAGTLAANRNIYTSVSAAIAALPRVIRFPILIEVANFGNLGKMEIHDFQIVENGSLEIINRNYGKIYNNNIANSTSSVVAVTGTVAGRTVPLRFDSADLSSTLGTGASATSAVSISSLVFSSSSDSRFNSVNCFVYATPSLRAGGLTFGLRNTTSFQTTTANRFLINVYESQYTSNDSPATLDYSSINQTTASRILRTAIATNNPILGSVYGNNLSKLSVKNCSGRIYIRNFCIDGMNRGLPGSFSTTSSVDSGVEINNSEVVLENCASVGSNINGFLFNNSKVILSRSAFAARNYKMTSASTRSSDQSCGFRAFNSEITLSASVGGGSDTSGVDYQTSGSDVVFCSSRNKIGFLLENSILTGGLQRLSISTELNKGVLAAQANEQYGIRAINSQINLKGLIDCYENRVGIDLLNSTLLAEELTCEGNGYEGIRARNSTTLINDSLTSFSATLTENKGQVDFSGNGQHLVLDNSIFTFKKGNALPSIYGSMKFKESHGVSFINNSKYHQAPAIYVGANSRLDLIHSQHLVSQATNTDGTQCYGRFIRADQNSVVSLFGTGNHCTAMHGPAGFLYQQFIAGLCGSNGSTINIHGPTAIGQVGIDVLVENNSTLNISPPKDIHTGNYDPSSFSLDDSTNQTTVELHATRACLVADNNSTINMQDVGDYGSRWNNLAKTYSYDLYSRGLVDVNPTSNPALEYAQFGAIQFWPNPPVQAVVDDNNYSSLGVALANNPKFSTYDPILSKYTYATGTPSLGGMCVRALGNSVINVKNVDFSEGPNTGPLDGVVYNASGAACDHLMIWNLSDDSKLRASLVSVSGAVGLDSPYHGPAAVWVSSASYGSNDASTAIAYGAPESTPDTGRLSVLDSFGAGGSALSSVWKPASGVGVNDPFDRYYPIIASAVSGGGQIVSSIVNYAGLAISGITTTGIQYGTSSNTFYRNAGLFRLYFSPDSAVDYLQHDVSGYAYGLKSWNVSGAPGETVSGLGAAYQVFAQGYNMSAPLSAISLTGTVSALFPQLMKLSRDTNGDGVPDTLHPSGFYYCIEFLKDNPSQVILDESASYAFQNARNLSLGSSGRPRRVTIYAPGTTQSYSDMNPGDYVGPVPTRNFDLRSKS